MGGDYYEKRCCEWSGMHNGTNDWVWDITMVVLGVILGVILIVMHNLMVTLELLEQLRI